MKRFILLIQCLMIIFCVCVVYLQISNFPFPSPLAKPLISPRLRWPELLVKKWIEEGNVDESFLEFFNRDPDRTIPPGRNFVAPADGHVKAIHKRGEINYFVIGLSFWDVHIVRAPMWGRVKSVTAEGDRKLERQSETAEFAYLKGKAGPVQKVITIENELGEFRLRLITSYWAKRIELWVQRGQTLEKGQRVGRILLGSSVVVEIPAGISLKVRQGERTVAGETILADLEDQR